MGEGSGVEDTWYFGTLEGNGSPDVALTQDVRGRLGRCRRASSDWVANAIFSGRSSVHNIHLPFKLQGRNWEAIEQDLPPCTIPLVCM